jgi:hypothetical protein
MGRSSFIPTLVWVSNDPDPPSKANIRSHIVKEGYRRKKVRGREGFSILSSQKKSILPEDCVEVNRSSPETPATIFKPTERFRVPAWVSFKLQDSLSTHQRDLFDCLPLNLDPIGQWELHRELSLGFTSIKPTYRYYFTLKYGSDPWQLAAELALQEPLAFRIFADFSIRNAEEIREGRPRYCRLGPEREEQLLALNADILGAIVKRLKSSDSQTEQVLNALMSLISRTANTNLPTWAETLDSHFRGFRSLFLLRQNPWKIHSRTFELRLIIFETCYSDGCWSFVCPPATFFARLSEFSKFIDRLQIFQMQMSKNKAHNQDVGLTSQHTLIDKDALTFRFLSKNIPMVRVVNGFHDESLAQLSVLLLLSATFLEYQGDRRKTKAFQTYVESEVQHRGLEYDESQWCLFWIMFLTRDPPTYTYNQERVWAVLRYMNIVKAISLEQRARLRAFLLLVISVETQESSIPDAFDIQSLVTELQDGLFACQMCGSRATFEGAHLHSSRCSDPSCRTCDFPRPVHTKGLPPRD